MMQQAVTQESLQGVNHGQGVNRTVHHRQWQRRTKIQTPVLSTDAMTCHLLCHSCQCALRPMRKTRLGSSMPDRPASAYVATAVQFPGSGCSVPNCHEFLGALPPHTVKSVRTHSNPMHSQTDRTAQGDPQQSTSKAQPMKSKMKATGVKGKAENGKAEQTKAKQTKVEAMAGS